MDELSSSRKTMRKDEWRPARWSRRTRENFKQGMLFLLPWTIGFVAFTLYPMIASLVYSFSIYHSRKPLEFVGLQNYANLLTDDLFWKALQNTMYMVIIAVPFTLLLAFLSAVLLNLKVKGQSIYRVIYFLPSIVPTVASTILWLWILNPQSGILNTILGFFGVQGPNWLSDPTWSKPSLIMLGIWGMGATIMIYLSGLQDVPVTLLEAAELDGAGWWQKMWYVTLPMVSPITVFALITGVIAMFQYFAQAYVFRGVQGLGYPLNSTLFYSVYLYQVGFLYLKMGYASAMAWVLFIIILVCTIILLKVSDRFAYYAG
jgi:multiple sugar transport system permease protein